MYEIAIRVLYIKYLIFLLGLFFSMGLLVVPQQCKLMFEEAFSIEKVWETHMSPISHFNDSTSYYCFLACHNDFQSKF